MDTVSHESPGTQSEKESAPAKRQARFPHVSGELDRSYEHDLFLMQREAARRLRLAEKAVRHTLKHNELDGLN